MTTRDKLKRWIAALESEDYTQGRGALYNNDANSFCCLGVACDLYAQDNPERAQWSGENFQVDEAYYAGLCAPIVLIDMDLKALTETTWGCGATLNILGTVANERNDDQRESFKQIAALLRIEHDLVNVNLDAHYKSRKTAT